MFSEESKGNIGKKKVNIIYTPSNFQGGIKNKKKDKITGATQE